MPNALRIPCEGSRFEVGESKTLFEVKKERCRRLWCESVVKNKDGKMDGKLINEIQKFKINGVMFGLESMKMRNGKIYVTIQAGLIKKTPTEEPKPEEYKEEQPAI